MIGDTGVEGFSDAGSTPASSTNISADIVNKEKTVAIRKFYTEFGIYHKIYELCIWFSCCDGLFLLYYNWTLKRFEYVARWGGLWRESSCVQELKVWKNEKKLIGNEPYNHSIERNCDNNVIKIWKKSGNRWNVGSSV